MKYFYCLLLFVVVGVSACQFQSASSQALNASNENSNSQIFNSSTPESQSDEEDKDVPIESIVSEKDFLDYKSYRIKKIVVKKSDDSNDGGPPTDIADAVLQKNGKTVLRFECNYNPAYNLIEFGLFSLLNKQEKQLIVFDSANRYGRIRVVDFSPQPKIVFDSEDWEGFREFIYFSDFDNDGIYEISLQREETASFEMVHLYIPQIGFHFKYDPKTQKYLPANHKFFEAGDLDKRILKMQSFGCVKGYDCGDFSDFLGIFLDYIYAGREEEAWAFYDKEYNLEDKAERKEKIKQSLRGEKIYNFVKNDLKQNQ